MLIIHVNNYQYVKIINPKIRGYIYYHGGNFHDMRSLESRA